MFLRNFSIVLIVDCELIVYRFILSWWMRVGKVGVCNFQGG